MKNKDGKRPEETPIPEVFIAEKMVSTVTGTKIDGSVTLPNIVTSDKWEVILLIMFKYPVLDTVKLNKVDGRTETVFTFGPESKGVLDNYRHNLVIPIDDFRSFQQADGLFRKLIR